MTSDQGRRPRRPATVSRQAIREGNRQLRLSANRSGEEMRELRLRAGVTQAAIARAIGVSRAVICELEHGDPSISPVIRARAASALGATFKFAVYGDGAPLIHDAAHARIVERVLALRHPRWHATLEAPVSDLGRGPGRRSSDLRLDHGRDIVLMEVETGIRRLEEIVREQHSKRDAVRRALDDGEARVHVVLVLPPTRHHRALTKTHPATIGTAYPTRSTLLREALESPAGAWPGDGLLWIASGRTTG